MFGLKTVFVAAVVAIAGSATFAMAAETDAAAKLSLAPNNIELSASVAGTYELSYPSLSDTRGQAMKRAQAPALAADRKSATISYEGGATSTVRLEDSGSLKIEFANLPANTKSFRMEMYLPMSYGSGGSFTAGDSPAKRFPADKPAKPFLSQGHGEKIVFTHPSGISFGLTTPASWTYQEVVDNREWNWSVFRWVITTDLPKGSPTASFSVSLFSPDGAAASKPKVLIDRYGQFVAANFPVKVTSDDDLKADVARDEAYYASLTPPATDSFGGLPGSGEKYGLKRTGYFHTAKADGKDVLVTPDGNAFFQIGICGMIPLDDFTLVKGREKIYEWLPEKTGEFATAYDKRKGDGVMSFYVANVIRKFGSPFSFDDHATRSIDRLRKWGFNSGGAWSFSADGVPAKKNFPTASFLPIDPGQLGRVASRDIWDPFAKDVESKLDTAFAKSLPKNAENPLIIGYFSANEPALDDIPKVVPTLKSDSGSKQRLVALLKETYPSIDAFNTAWELSADSFDVLPDMPLAVKTEAASRDMQAFFKLFMQRRYELVATTFHKYDKNHLLLGDRLTPGVANNKTVVEAIGPYVDVVSVNYYAYGIDTAFLGRIHEWAVKKPLLLSEFHFTCTDQGLPTGHSSVATQADRGEAYRSYVEQAAATGFIVGIQWFEGLDQAPTGRWFQGFNGESTNTGLLNVTDRPYKEFLAPVMQANYGIYDVLLNGKSAYVAADPRFNGDKSKATARQTIAIPHLAKPFVNDNGYSEFPGVPPTRIGGDRMVLGADAAGLEATYRVAWDDSRLYVYVDVIDATPMKNTCTADGIWSGDAVELFVGPQNTDEGGAPKFSDRHILLRGANTPGKAGAFVVDASKQPEIETIVGPNSDGRGYTIKAAVPFTALGFTPKQGQKVLFDVAIDDSSDGLRRERQLAWNGTERNSKDRSAWGVAEFVP